MCISYSSPSGITDMRTIEDQQEGTPEMEALLSRLSRGIHKIYNGS